MARRMDAGACRRTRSWCRSATASDHAGARRTPCLMAAKLRTSAQLYRHLVSLYAQGSTAAVVVVLFLVLIGLEFTGRQWAVLLGMLPMALAIYVIPDIYLIARHYRPLRAVLTKLDAGE